MLYSVVATRGQLLYIQSQKSACFACLIFSHWAAPSEGRRWYPRKQLHSSRYRIGGSPLSFQTRWSSRRGLKAVVSLCLSVLLLMFGSFPGQLEARASCWCSVVRFFLLLLCSLLIQHCCEVGLCCFENQVLPVSHLIGTAFCNYLINHCSGSPEVCQSRPAI